MAQRSWLMAHGQGGPARPPGHHRHNVFCWTIVQNRPTDKLNFTPRLSKTANKCLITTKSCGRLGFLCKTRLHHDACPAMLNARLARSFSRRLSYHESGRKGRDHSHDHHDDDVHCTGPHQQLTCTMAVGLGLKCSFWLGMSLFWNLVGPLLCGLRLGSYP